MLGMDTSSIFLCFVNFITVLSLARQMQEAVLTVQCDRAASLVWLENKVNLTKKRATRASALRADETQHTRGLVLTP